MLAVPDEAQEVADDEWLERAGREGWIVFTKDKRIRYRHVEIEAREAAKRAAAG